MPAFRSRNLRSGDIAEQLGLLLLQSVGLVAPVPRTEDVGIDAVFTFLEDFDRHRFKASTSFFVQLKSKSVDSIEYVGEEVRWLFELELPFFIGSVDRSTGSMDLYCCHNLSEAFVSSPSCNRISIRTDHGIKPTDFHPAADVVNVGPPVFSWSLDDVETNPELRNQFNLVCKAHARAAKTSIEQRRVGMVETVTWETNKVPEMIGWKSRVLQGDEVVDDIADITMPYLLMFWDACLTRENMEWLDEILLLTQKYRMNLFFMQEMKKNPGGKIKIPEEFQAIYQKMREELKDKGAPNL